MLPVRPVIEQLALTLPGAAAAEPLDFPAYSALASRVIDLLAAGRDKELSGFFAALESAYLAPQDEATSNALYEGFMESFLMGLEHARIPHRDAYQLLRPVSRRVWQTHWDWVYDSPWGDG